MITIKTTSREFTPVEKYLMTTSPDITSMKDVADGEKITVDGYLTFDDVKEKTGEVVEVLSIITPEKKVYSCVRLESRHIDDICFETGISVSEVTQILYELEQKRLIKQIGRASCRERV